MEMIILNDEELSGLKEINTMNLHLNRAIQSVKLGENEHGVNSDIMDDRVTWERWIDFLQDKPRKEINLTDLQKDIDSSEEEN
jgi:hypothetical protein